MQSRLHFTGNGYAGQLLNMIRNGKSAFTLMSVYDFMVLKFQIQNLILNKKIYSYEKIIKIGNYNNVEFYQSTNHRV